MRNFTFFLYRQLKDRRKNRSRQLADKNSGPSGILRFGSLSVKVKKTTEAFNNYFNHSEKKHSQDNQPYSLPTIGNFWFFLILKMILNMRWRFWVWKLVNFEGFFFMIFGFLWILSLWWFLWLFGNYLIYFICMNYFVNFVIF